MTDEDDFATLKTGVGSISYGYSCSNGDSGLFDCDTRGLTPFVGCGICGGENNSGIDIFSSYPGSPSRVTLDRSKPHIDFFHNRKRNIYAGKFDYS